ncbi:aminotransferase class IV [Acetobacter sp. DsW_059]|uniref:aminotransferase class IV n=1 Tax=Acetobacter sp. DsW_059 TaxID=1670661 RepID=UPI000A36D1BB|nr:aminotransferase class IV [Acetobacter sp. DsW_059]OUJ10905.1 aminotransferase [Acetobacter sp. DsW_059]
MKGVVWLNGALCPADKAYVSVADRGLTLGDGLFETFRVDKGKLLHIGLHMARLQAGSTVLALPVPEQDVVEQAAASLLGALNIEQGSARLTVTRGAGPRGIAPPAQSQPTVFMTASEGASVPADVTLITSQLVRQDELSVLCQFKTLNYLPSILARQEAIKARAGDALILNTKGRVAETTVSSVLVQKAGRFLTPSQKEGALPGVACAVLRQKGLLDDVVLTREDLIQADAVYLVNALSLRCVTSLDGMPLRQDRNGFYRVCKELSLIT